MFAHFQVWKLRPSGDDIQPCLQTCTTDKDCKGDEACNLEAKVCVPLHCEPKVSSGIGRIEQPAGSSAVLRCPDGYIVRPRDGLDVFAPVKEAQVSCERKDNRARWIVNDTTPREAACMDGEYMPVDSRLSNRAAHLNKKIAERVNIHFFFYIS